MKLTNQDIIIVGIQPWDTKIGSNCKNIALELARNNKVLYVNYPLDRKTRFRHKNDPAIQKRIRIAKSGLQEIVEVQENFWNLYPSIIIESIGSLKINCLFDLINRLNNWRIANEIKKAIKKLNFKNYLIFNDSDMFRSFYLKEFLKPKIYIYYTRDNLIAFDYWKTQGKRMEPKIMQKADLVVANSVYLAEIARKYNPNSYYVGQGCDVKNFEKSKITLHPDDILAIKKPIIGYIGVLTSIRLDIQVLIHIAKSLPELSLVLIGPEDENFKNSELHQLKNVYFLGNKPENEVPVYVNHFDVAINPQELNETTIGNYPRKIDEYLALGKPVVATKTLAMSVFNDYTYLAENKEEYVKNILTALDENSAEKEKMR
jgi:glycosyltransferase involved in cell wall biosynthesis